MAEITSEEAEAELLRRQNATIGANQDNAPPEITSKEAEAELFKRFFGGPQINSVFNFPTDEQLRQNPGAQVPKPESFLEKAGEVFTGDFRSSSSSLNFDSEGNVIREIEKLPGFDEITQGPFNNAIASEFGLGNQLLAQVSSLASLTQNNKIKGILNLLPGTRVFIDQNEQKSPGFGEVMFVTPEGIEFVLNQPGGDTGDILSLAVPGAAFMKGAKAVAKATPGGASFFGKSIRQGLGQGAVATTLDITSDVLSGRDIDVDPLATGIASAVGLAFPTFAFIGNKVRLGKAGNSLDINNEALKSGLDLLGKANQVLAKLGIKNIPVSFAQVIGQKGYLGVFRDMQRLPAVSEKVKGILNGWNVAILNATDTFIRNISRATPTAMLQSMKTIRDRSASVLAAMKQTFREQNNVAFKAAFDSSEANGTKIDVSPIIDGLKTRLAGTKEKPLVGIINRLIKGIEEAAIPIKGKNSNLKTLADHVETIESLIVTLKSPQQRQAAINTVRNLRDTLTKSDPLFAQAQATFTANNAALKKFEASPFGALGLIDERNIPQVAQIIFGKDATRQTVIQTRGEIIKAFGKEKGQALWDDIVATELKARTTGRTVTALNRSGKPIVEPQGDVAANTPKEILESLVGKKGQDFRKIRVSLSPEMRKGLDSFIQILNFAKKGRAPSSSTTSNEAQEIAGTINLRQKFFSLITFGPRGFFGEPQRRQIRATFRNLVDTYFDPTNQDVVGNLSDAMKAGRWTEAEGFWLQIVNIAEERDNPVIIDNGLDTGVPVLPRQPNNNGGFGSALISGF